MFIVSTRSQCNVKHKLP